MNKLWVSAGIEVTEGKDIKQAAEALNKLAAITRQETGNITFEVLQHQTKPENFTLWECWDDDKALEKHFTLPHTLAYLSEEWTKVIYVERLQMMGTNEKEVDE